MLIKNKVYLYLALVTKFNHNYESMTLYGVGLSRRGGRLIVGINFFIVLFHVLEYPIYNDLGV